MTDLQAALQVLSSGEKQQLAHSLLLALEGRTAAGNSRDTGSEVAPAHRRKAGEEAFPESLRTGREETLRNTPKGQEGIVSVPEAQPFRFEQTPPVSTVSAGDGAPSPENVRDRRESVPFAVLRREPPDFDTGPRESTEADPVRQMRQISDYFRQDSRRFDPGFTRY